MHRPYISPSQPFFSYGTLTWNQSPACTPLHFWYKFVNDVFSHLQKEIPTKFQICNTLESVLISDIAVEVCRGQYVENERLSMRVDNFIENSLLKLLTSSLPTFGHCYRSHGTPVCRSTQVGKHCPTFMLHTCINSYIKSPPPLSHRPETMGNWYSFIHSGYFYRASLSQRRSRPQ